MCRGVARPLFNFANRQTKFADEISDTGKKGAIKFYQVAGNTYSFFLQSFR